MGMLRLHPPPPAFTFVRRLGLARPQAENLYAEIRRSHRALTWPGIITGLCICCAWWTVFFLVIPFFFEPEVHDRDRGLLSAALSFLYYVILSLAGGLYVGSIVKWYLIDRAIRRFITEYIDTPKCLACDCGLTGVPRSADGELRCPECTQNWPWHTRAGDPRPHMSAIDPPRQPDAATGQEPAEGTSR